MAPHEVSKKRKAAAPTTTTPPKKARKATKDEPKAVIPSSKSKKSKPVPAVPEPADQDDTIAFEEEAEDIASEDDQTAALLAGFESSSDEEDDVVPKDTLEVAITKIPSIPSSDALQVSLSTANASSSKEPGVIYIGRIPHGFYEHQMRAYFSQFGEISRLRLSRNRQTGASKHYAFVEFATGEVAKIVADTMDNYLMFGHLLKVKLIPKEQVHAELFKGANKRFKKVPWNRIDRFRLQSTDREGWSKRIKGEEKRRKDKADKLKALGYEFEAPSLRQVEDVPVLEPVPAKAVEAEETAKQVESAHVQALESGAADEAAKEEQGPVSSEPLAIAAVPRGKGSLVEEEDALAGSADGKTGVIAESGKEAAKGKPGKQKTKTAAPKSQENGAKTTSPTQAKAGKKQQAEKRGSNGVKVR